MTPSCRFKFRTATNGGGHRSRVAHPQKSRPKDIPTRWAVLDRMDIPRAFRRSSRKLTDEQIAAVFERDRRSTTWVTREAS